MPPQKNAEFAGNSAVAEIIKYIKILNTRSKCIQECCRRLQLHPLQCYPHTFLEPLLSRKSLARFASVGKSSCPAASRFFGHQQSMLLWKDWPESLPSQLICCNMSHVFFWPTNELSTSYTWGGIVANLQTLQQRAAVRGRKTAHGSIFRHNVVAKPVAPTRTANLMHIFSAIEMDRKEYEKLRHGQLLRHLSTVPGITKPSAFGR